MRAFGLAVLGVLAYLVFLVASLPASLVAQRVARETVQAVQLEGARGTAWKGEARLRVEGTSLGLLQWRWQPASLAAGRLGFALHVNEPHLEAAGELARGIAAWELRGTARGSAEALGAAIPQVAPWRPQGSVDLDVPALSWTPSSLAGEARLEWREAGVGIAEVRPLGHYRAELRGDGAAARVTLATLQGPLQLAASGSLTPQGRLSLRGEARAEGPQAAALQPLLDLIGPRNPDGSRTFGVGSGAP